MSTYTNKNLEQLIIETLVVRAWASELPAGLLASNKYWYWDQRTVYEATVYN